MPVCIEAGHKDATSVGADTAKYTTTARHCHLLGRTRTRERARQRTKHVLRTARAAAATAAVATVSAWRVIVYR